ncbi:putative RDD family membrane protein YckC [Luteibacter rhizovicinus]|uniref:Putative RDD family membrane protein YckC n=1 Tax=Luteibacter rhizovicinus TaxID=242606 RepID=A0A4R3YJU1_9GAMM|nr:RDD family protein [Luteibacter rhizovicinus]TCV92431.1 putative RDD family membrane protein YckC [Luteibacter rhizovicinus]
MTKQVWIGRQGERLGPYTEDEVRAWLRDRTYRPDELGWYEGMTEWRPLGELFPDARPEPGPATAPPSPPPFLGITDVAEPLYAGFWLRFAAWVIDYLILLVPFTVIALSMGLAGAASHFMDVVGSDRVNAMSGYVAALRPISLATTIAGFIYYAAFECSKWQATPGKLAVGLRVTDMQGERLSFGRSIGRNAVRLVNVVIWLIPMICYLVAAWTERKQGVHDMLAGTLVLQGRVGEVAAAAPPYNGGGSFNA